MPQGWVSSPSTSPHSLTAPSSHSRYSEEKRGGREEREEKEEKEDEETREEKPLLIPSCDSQGWNSVSVTPTIPLPSPSTSSSANLLESGEAYFSNSFTLQAMPLGWKCALSYHGGDVPPLSLSLSFSLALSHPSHLFPLSLSLSLSLSLPLSSSFAVSFVSAIERGAVVATQFHPELSGEYGLALIRRWIQTSDVPKRQEVEKVFFYPPDHLLGVTLSSLSHVPISTSNRPI